MAKRFAAIIIIANFIMGLVLYISAQEMLLHLAATHPVLTLTGVNIDKIYIGAVQGSSSRARMLVPGTEFPHLCTQCEDYPCVAACLSGALGVNRKTSAVVVDEAKCTGCGRCIEACPGGVPHVHPKTKKILICDLCGGEPQCAKVCQESGWNCLKVVAREDHEFRLFARPPEETAKALATKLYGEKAEEFL